LISKILYRTRGFYYLTDNHENIIESKIKRSLYKDKKNIPNPIVGDNVVFDLSGNEGEHGLITEILPRESLLKRAKFGSHREIIMAVNVDYCLIILPLKMPTFDLFQTLKVITACYQGNVKPIVVLTKSDLVTDEERERQKKYFENIDIPAFVTSTLSPVENDNLKNFIFSKQVTLCGISGAGKSSLINAMFPVLDLKTGEVNSRHSYGRHTTTMSRMFSPEEGYNITDNPGFKNFYLTGVERKKLKLYYPVIRNYTDGCRMKDCEHVKESDCKILNLLGSNQLDPLIYEHYLTTLMNIS